MERISCSQIDADNNNNNNNNRGHNVENSWGEEEEQGGEDSIKMALNWIGGSRSDSSQVNCAECGNISHLLRQQKRSQEGARHLRGVPTID